MVDEIEVEDCPGKVWRGEGIAEAESWRRHGRHFVWMERR
jgi:hypothetical protein